VKHFFHGKNPLGRQFEIDDPAEKGKPFTVIGVSQDAKDHREFLRQAAPPRFYTAFQQSGDPKRFVLEISVDGNPSAIFYAVRSGVKTLDSKLTLDSIYTVSYLIERSVGNQIALAQLSGFFAVLALLLACIGLYGVMSYTVAGRTREMGLRLALGAQRGDVLQLVLQEGMVLVAIGIGIGIPLSIAGSRVLDSYLFGLKGSDPGSLATVIVALSVVATVAGFIPARRATKVDPIVALRYE
jgi:ABC-type antimicrobial peptide transport system permease subunit